MLQTQDSRLYRRFSTLPRDPYGHFSYQDRTNQDPLSLNSESAALRSIRRTKKRHPLTFKILFDSNPDCRIFVTTSCVEDRQSGHPSSKPPSPRWLGSDQSDAPLRLWENNSRGLVNKHMRSSATGHAHAAPAGGMQDARGEFSYAQSPY